MQVLHVMVGICYNIFDNGVSDRVCYPVVCAFLFNPFNPGQMVKVKIGKHEVKLYDAIDELPIARFHKYQKYLLIDAGIGGDIQSFDSRTEKIRRFLSEGQTDNAIKELGNLRQSVYLILAGINPKHKAFASLVTEIDGEKFDTITDDVIERINELLSDVSIKDLAVPFEAAKKKLIQN